MYQSTYIPVNMKRPDCAVYSKTNKFPEDRLIRAYKYISGEKVTGLSMDENFVVFLDDQTIRWTIPEIMQAYYAYTTAADNSFSYYTINGDDGVPHLFVSKVFRSHRILVNALTMQSVILSNRQHISKVASLINKTVGTVFCYNLFRVISSLEENKGRFLTSLIVYRDTQDEAVVLSPITSEDTGNGFMIGIEVIEDWRNIIDNKLTEGDLFTFDGSVFTHKILTTYEPVSLQYVQYAISQYDRAKSKKSNYIDLENQNYHTMYFYSTNQRYLVNAKTLECLIVSNRIIKKQLNDCAAKAFSSNDKLLSLWLSAQEDSNAEKAKAARQTSA